MLRAYARRRLYQPDAVPPRAGKYGGAAFEPIKAHLPNGSALTGLASATSDPRFTVLFLHGNGGSAPSRAHLPAPLVGMGARVIVADYPGYGTNDGRPSEGTIDTAAGAFLDVAIADAERARTERPDEADDHALIVIGHSLGGNVAVRLAAERAGAVDGLLTFHAFPHLSAVAGRFGSVVLGEAYDARSHASRIACPWTIAHAVADAIVPFAAGRALHALVADRSNVRFAPLQTADHQIAPDAITALVADLGQRIAVDHQKGAEPEVSPR